MNNIPLSQKQVILGGLLGDAYYNKKTKIIRFAQCAKQEEYLKYKYSLFDNNSITNIYTRNYDEGFISYYFQIKYDDNIYGDLYQFIAKHLYSNAGRKKISPKYLKELDSFGLAIWWMDDGSLCKSKGNRWGKLCTECFNYEEHILIQTYFREKWGIDVKITKEKDKYYYINFNAHALRKLIAIIYPHILQVPSMIYKIDMDYIRKIDLGDFQKVYDEIEAFKTHLKL